MAALFPDLNSIENLWTLLKQKIYELRPNLLHMANDTSTLYILIEISKEAWHDIDFSILERLEEIMPRQVLAIIDSNG
jgi:hypothetical protein